MVIWYMTRRLTEDSKYSQYLLGTVICGYISLDKHGSSLCIHAEIRPLRTESERLHGGGWTVRADVLSEKQSPRAELVTPKPLRVTLKQPLYNHALQTYITLPQPLSRAPSVIITHICFGKGPAGPSSEGTQTYPASLDESLPKHRRAVCWIRHTLPWFFGLETDPPTPPPSHSPPPPHGSFIKINTDVNALLHKIMLSVENSQNRWVCVFTRQPGSTRRPSPQHLPPFNWKRLNVLFAALRLPCSLTSPLTDASPP